MVLNAFNKDKQHFGFIKVKEKKLAELTTLFSPGSMPLNKDVYSFRAGVWMVVIVSHEDWVEVTILDPYNMNDHFSVSA